MLLMKLHCVKILNNTHEVENILSSYSWENAGSVSPFGYHAYYDCGCGGQHVLSEGRFDFIAWSKPGAFSGFIFLLRCEENWVTGVRVKGMIKQTVSEDFSFNSELMLDA